MKYLQSTHVFFLELKRIFKRLDENGDGRVSIHELGRAMRYLGMNPTKKDIQRILSECDKNGKSLSDTLFRSFLGLAYVRIVDTNFRKPAVIFVDFSQRRSSVTKSGGGGGGGGTIFSPKSEFFKQKKKKVAKA